jgi:rhamnose transport system ATP-binding protein
LVIDATVANNITDAIRPTLTKFGLITMRAENAATQEWAKALEVKTASLDAVAGTLSGGNQQKSVLAKWIAANPQILIIDEPTRGIDVGTKSEVHRRMSDLAGKGLAVLMISSELPEVLGMADRILVMHEGRITAEIARENATPETVMYAATHSQGVPA